MQCLSQARGDIDGAQQGKPSTHMGPIQIVKHWLTWYELLQGRDLRRDPGGLVLLEDSNGLELDLMERNFAMAHFKSKCSRALDGSNQGKKQASS